MPLYDYTCSECEHILIDVRQSFKDEPLLHCDECGNDSLQRTIYAPHVFVRQEPKTLGALADRNTENMSKEEHAIACESVDNPFKKEQEKPSLTNNKHTTANKKEIRKMNSTQIDKYIETGEK